MDPILIDVPPLVEQVIQERTDERNYWREVVNAPSVRAEDRATLPEQPGERNVLYWKILEWLGKRWDISDEEFALTVDGVCSGNEKVWAIWLDLAPIDKLRDGLLIIEAEDNLYQEASPWRQPIQYRYTAEEMRMRLGVTT